MPPYVRHAFVCGNVRPESDPRGCCSAKGSGEVLARMKEAVHAADLKGRVRVNSSGCLGLCAHGVAVVVYPEAVWYGHVTVQDAERIAAQHLIDGCPVGDLRLPHVRSPE